jgi:glycosyltransferase involved in cell wall biosynthesis
MSSNKTPLVSIIVPTYNRADTIGRAIKSVQKQNIQDWELIIVDDGSTDDTVSVVDGIDSRLKLIRQENRGFVHARNAGLQASTGKYIAFLDSDDEWLPYHLDLTVGFLEAFPEEHFVSAELIEDFGRGRLVNHYRVETSEWYPKMASQIRSRSLDLPSGSKDDYLRVYEAREAIGEWGDQALEKAGIKGEAFLYHGKIFEHLRWGYLIAVNATVLRRTALEIVGLQDPSYNAAADYHFIATLCRNFRANFLGLPTYIKHELTSDGELPSSSHVATGASAFTCAKDMLRSYEDLFCLETTHDRELLALRGLKQLFTAQTALDFGQREQALSYLSDAKKSLPRFWRAIVLEWFVRCLPRPHLSKAGWVLVTKADYAWKQLLRGELSTGTFVTKAMSQLKGGSVSRGRASLIATVGHLLFILLSDDVANFVCESIQSF